eukprot:jgi/Phyca11/99940/e_gw1.4.1003.1
MYWRTPSFNLTRFVISLGFGLLGGATYLGTEFNTYAGVNSGMGMVFSVLGFLGITSFNSMVPVAAEGRVIFYRERAGQTYNAFWFFFGSSVVEIPYVFVAVLLFMALFYPLILGMIVNLITFLFAGFSPPAASLPLGVKWIYHVNPLTYALSAASASLLSRDHQSYFDANRGS